MKQSNKQLKSKPTAVVSLIYTVNDRDICIQLKQHSNIQAA